MNKNIECKVWIKWKISTGEKCNCILYWHVFEVRASFGEPLHKQSSAATEIAGSAAH